MPSFAALETNLLPALTAGQVCAAAAVRFPDGLSTVRPWTPLQLLVCANFDIFTDSLEHFCDLSGTEALDFFF